MLARPGAADAIELEDVLRLTYGRNGVDLGELVPLFTDAQRAEVFLRGIGRTGAGFRVVHVLTPEWLAVLLSELRSAGVTHAAFDLRPDGVFPHGVLPIESILGRLRELQLS